MPWWGWIVVGVVLLGAETIVSTEFYLAILGVAAVLVGAVLLAGVVPPVWAQWLLFGVLSVGLTVSFRRRFWGRLTHTDTTIEDSLIGELVCVSEPVAPGQRGSGELRGSVWNVENIGGSTIDAGRQVRVLRVDGLVLKISNDD